MFHFHLFSSLFPSFPPPPFIPDLLPALSSLVTALGDWWSSAKHSWGRPQYCKMLECTFLAPKHPVAHCFAGPRVCLCECVSALLSCGRSRNWLLQYCWQSTFPKKVRVKLELGLHLNVIYFVFLNVPRDQMPSFSNPPLHLPVQFKLISVFFNHFHYLCNLILI